MKHKRIKEIDLFLPNEEIEKLNDRYELLYKRVKHATDLSLAQIDRECEILLLKYNFEIKELSALYEAEYWKRQAEIAAKNAEQIPWRRCWLWRLLFRPLTNRAQDIIEMAAALDAEELFAPLEKELKARFDKLYGKKQHWWQLIFHKKDLLTTSTAAHVASDATHQSDKNTAPEQEPEPPAPPTRKPRNNKVTGDNTP